MGLFSAIVRTTVNVVLLPVAVAKDAFTLGGVCTGQQDEKGKTYTQEQIDLLKKEAED